MKSSTNLYDSFVTGEILGGEGIEYPPRCLRTVIEVTDRRNLTKIEILKFIICGIQGELLEGHRMVNRTIPTYGERWII